MRRCKVLPLLAFLLLAAPAMELHAAAPAQSEPPPNAITAPDSAQVGELIRLRATGANR